MLSQREGESQSYLGSKWNHVSNGIGEASAEKGWVILSSMFSRAEAWSWVPRNPVRAARKPRKKNSKRVPRALSVEEIERLRSVLDRRDATLVSVLAYAGLRPGEALALRWEDIRERTLYITRALSFGEEKSTKTRRNRSVPLIGALRMDLAAWRPASKNNTLLFPNGNGGPWDEGHYRRWRRFVFKPALKDAGLPDDIRPYDLRHAMASMLVASGVGIVEAAAQLGHAPTVLLDTYAHVLGGPMGS